MTLPLDLQYIASKTRNSYYAPKRFTQAASVVYHFAFPLDVKLTAIHLPVVRFAAVQACASLQFDRIRIKHLELYRNRIIWWGFLLLHVTRCLLHYADRNVTTIAFS